jgi:alanine-glyoxylate transaminase/serine-glyoxylate transaminase/serine-pyruvate transaminase
VHHRALPHRLLLGSGPSNVHPRVLAAIAQPLIGHSDPDFLAILEEVEERLRELFGTRNSLTLPLPTSGGGGMEACLANLLEAEDDIVVGVTGTFGERISEFARRSGARVCEVRAEPGAALDDAQMAEAIARLRPAVVALVHGETSTGVHQPVEPIAEVARNHDALVVLDCVTSLGGAPVRLDDWGIDAAYSSIQRCLSCPPGLAPASFSERAVEKARNRRTPVQSWLLDITRLADRPDGERTRRYATPISLIFALNEALRLIEEEGMPIRVTRHRAAADALIEGLAEFGFAPLVAAPHRLPALTTVRVPEAIRRTGEASLRRQLLDKYGIEISGGLGPLAGEIWRIGLMGENARITNVEALLCALRHELG